MQVLNGRKQYYKRYNRKYNYTYSYEKNICDILSPYFSLFFFDYTTYLQFEQESDS